MLKSLIWLPFYYLFFSVPEVQGQIRYDTKALSLQLNPAHRLIALENRLSGVAWLSGSSEVFKVEANGEVSSSLEVRPMPDGEIKLCLSVTNIAGDSVLVSPVFPMLSHLAAAGIGSEQLYYLFPKQGGWVMNEDNMHLSEPYSGKFPLQFIDLYTTGKGGGIYLMSQDTTNIPKQFYLNKQHGEISMGIVHRPKRLAPGETWVLPPMVLGAHPGDWHQAFFAYREWLRSWYKPATARKNWFRDIYNFRQVFLHPIFGGDGLWDPVSKKIDLIKEVRESKKAFGGVEYVHVFDWGQTPEYGRTGDYDPWNYLGGKKQFHRQIRLLHRKGIRTGLYFEGYLVDKHSRTGKANGSAWQMLDSLKKPYTRFGTDVYYMCPYEEEWKNYIRETVTGAVSKTGVDGAYLDEYGFGWQYGCYNPQHSHDSRKTRIQGELQVPMEAGLMKQVKHSLPGSKVTYSEEMPTDVSTQYQDGSFTYAVSVAGNKKMHNPASINIARFALPDFKLLEILHVDNPMGNDTDGIKRVFFNGEGLWIEGPLNNSKWFPEATRALIRKTHAILTANKEAFRSESPVPNVPSLDSSVYVNYFPSPHKNVWTFYNVSDKTYGGGVLRIPHKEGAVYYDAWNEKIIYPDVENGFCIIKLTVGSRDIGCLVESF